MRQKLRTWSLYPGTLIVASFLCMALPAMAATRTFDSRIAFVMGADIYSTNPDGSDVKQLTMEPANTTTSDPAWSPDGQSIIYFVGASDFSSSSIWEMNANGSNQRQIFADLAGNLPAAPSFSPDGTKIVMHMCKSFITGPCAIYRIQADGAQLTPLTHFGPNPDISDVLPKYSPDGRTIAFTSFARGGFKSAIYLIDQNGQNLRLLTAPELQGAQARWSPDGRKLVFEAHFSSFGGETHGFNEEIWTIGADGAGATRVTNNNHGLPIYSQTPHDYFPAFSPEGDQIVFERDNGPQTVFSLYVINADGSGEQAVTEARPLIGRNAASADFSASGRAASQPKPRRIETGGGDASWSPEL